MKTFNLERFVTPTSLTRHLEFLLGDDYKDRLPEIDKELNLIDGLNISMRQPIHGTDGIYYMKRIEISIKLWDFYNSMNPVNLEFSNNMTDTYLGSDYDEIDTGEHIAYAINLSQQKLLLSLLQALGVTHKHLYRAENAYIVPI